MATKSRHLKTAMQLWIVDNRKRLGLESLDLANLTGVTEGTARGWESRGKPNDDAIRLLEVRFGQAAPKDPDATTASGGQDALVAALTAQADALNKQADALDRLAKNLEAVPGFIKFVELNDLDARGEREALMEMSAKILTIVRDSQKAAGPGEGAGAGQRVPAPL